MLQFRKDIFANAILIELGLYIQDNVVDDGAIYRGLEYDADTDSVVDEGCIVMADNTGRKGKHTTQTNSAMCARNRRHDSR